MISPIPEYVGELLKKLNNAGFEGYPVGGCVRDTLLGKAPHDWDICTDASPDEMKAIFGGMRIIDTGIKHGTLTVISGGRPVEMTTYRTDGEYEGHRKPLGVTFVKSLREDLARRDFTINALCFDPHGGVIDMFGGINDLKAGIIRCVGDAEKRFDEDALRILRALRFSSVLDINIEKSTAEAVHKKAELLRAISAERIYSELSKLLTGARAGDILIEYRDVFGVIIPELKECFDVRQNNPHHKYDVYTHICRSVDNIPPDPVLRLTMLLHDIGKPRCRTTDERGIDHFKMHPSVGAEMAEGILENLRTDNHTRALICEYIKEHDNRLSQSRRSVARFISKHGYEFFDNYILIRRADTLAQSLLWRDEKLADLEALKKIRRELEEQEACLTLKDLDINGRDMIALGLRGKEIGLMLERVLEAVAEGSLKNDKKEIECFVRDTITAEKQKA